MKIYRRHRCESAHRTFNKLARCMFPRAGHVIGEGPFASVAWCRVVSVQLHATREDAQAAVEFIGRHGCGGRCRGDHEVIVVVKS